jgi:hypothetical protein
MNRSELIAAMQLTAAEKPVPVEVKGWGTVYIRALTVAEVEEQADDVADKNDKSRIARGAARLLCDEDGKMLFDPKNEEDIKLLAKQPWRLIRKIIDASDINLKKVSEGN